MAVSQELHSQIRRLIEDAQQDEAAEKRAKLFQRYMGEPYGDEVAGRSAFVSTDVADAVEAILPDVMDVFTSTEGMVEFQPVGPDDEEAARQETDVVEHVFWQKNNGFEILYTWIKEGLIQQNSYIRFGWDDRERVEVEEYESLDANEVIAILDEKEAAGTEYEALETEAGEDGTVNLTLRCVTREKRYLIECIPQEEFFHTPRWNKVSLDGIPCCGHRRTLTKGDLRAMGFSADSIDRAKLETHETQADQRFTTADSFETERNTGDGATEEVTVYEAYLRVDLNDDGKAELVRVWAAGEGASILQWEDGSDAVDEVSGLPFAAWTPYIIPHRHIGRSVSEQVDDIQQVKTVLIRHTLDNLYLTNYARPQVDEQSAGPHLFEDLAAPAPGKPIRTGGAPVEWIRPPPVIDTTLPIIQGMDELKENRVGATRYNQGLDAESLNKTATGVQMIMNASQKKSLLIARTFAETGLRDLFLGIHRDLRNGPLKRLAMKLRGAWVEVNPRLWKDRTDMTVSIGNSREVKRNAFMLLGQIQRELAEKGSRIVDESRVFNLTTEMMKTFGFVGIKDFMHDPAELPPPEPPQPSPQEQALLMQAQLMQADMQRRAEKDRMDHEARMKELELRERQIAADEAAKASRVMTDEDKLQLDRQKAVMEDDFKRDKLEIDALTGWNRSDAQPVRSDPPVRYDDVTG